MWSAPIPVRAGSWVRPDGSQLHNASRLHCGFSVPKRAGAATGGHRTACTARYWQVAVRNARAQRRTMHSLMQRRYYGECAHNSRAQFVC